MRTIWVVEKSKTVREMVRIALQVLPVELRFASSVSELVGSADQEAQRPSLLVCAERLKSRVSDQSAEHFEDLKDQLVTLRASEIACPVLVLLDQRGGGALSEDQLRSLMKRAELGYAGAVRKPFKTQTMVEAAARSLMIQAPHTEVFAEQNRVIPLARHSKVAPQPIITAEVASESAQTIPPQGAQLDTPQPTTMGTLLQSATPDNARPQQILKSASYRAPSPRPANTLDSSDLSPPMTPLQQAEDSPTASAPEHPQLKGDWLESREGGSVRSEPSAEELKTVRDTELNAPVLDAPVLNVPALAPNEPVIDDEAKTQESDSNHDASAEINTETSAERVLSMAREAVQASTERALKVALRAQEAHAGHLSADEARALIERVAWEVVPAVARDVLSELIDAELTRDRRLS